MVLAGRRRKMAEPILVRRNQIECNKLTQNITRALIMELKFSVEMNDLLSSRMS
jgi:hypothetical protein